MPQPILRTDRLLLVPLTLGSGMAIYIGLIVIGATVTFWTIRTPEVINVFTFGGVQMTQYPLSIYQEWLRAVFLFLIPVTFVFHAFWGLDAKEAATQQIQFLKNLSIMGGMLMVVAHGAGAYSLDKR